MRTSIVCSVFALATATSAPANAAYVINFEEVGSDVIATGSGSLDISGLSAGLPGLYNASVFPYPFALVGSGSGKFFYDNFSFTGPSSFGPGPGAHADSYSGQVAGLFGSTALMVPSNYISGSDLGISTGTWQNKSFATLGLIPGTYVWTWGATHPIDTITVKIGAGVPEPATWAMMIIGFGLIGGAMRKRRQLVSYDFA